MVVRACLFLACWFLFGQDVQAQVEEGVEEDSLRTYDLDEIVVRGTDRQVVSANTLQRVSLAAIAQTNAASVDQLARLIPAAHVQTNSRGETLVYLRSAGERQVALFFDGALLNVPWDNRFDLSLVPAGVVGGMTVAKGVPSVLYGTNVLGGAINLTSRQLLYPGRFTEVTGMAGTPDAAHARLTHLGRTERFSYAFSFGYDERDGLALPDGADLSFNQVDDNLRTNTDRRLINAFGQTRYQFNNGLLVGLSLLHLDGRKGVAPEGHLDPEQAHVRFWRYPDWRTSMVVLSGQFRFPGRGALLRGAAWGSQFAQTIERFPSDQYERLLETQDDDDRTRGTRLTLLQPTTSGELRLSLNALTSQHRQQDQAFDEAGNPAPADPSLTFLQHVWSVGAEYEWDPTSRLGLIFGGSLDGIATPETGDKPARDRDVNFGITSGLLYELNDAWTLRASAGRKIRFPTMRELFGEALGRFLVNPDLQPESSLLTEVGLVSRRRLVSGEVTAFFNRTFDTIDQRSVLVPGEDRPRRQRVNLDGSRVIGVEAAGALQSLNGLSVAGNLTWTHARAFEDGTMRRLAERPEWLGTLTVVHNRLGRFSTLLQTVLAGVAYSPDEENTFQKLPASLVINARAGYRLVRSKPPIVATELFARVDNVTDEVTLPQLGLPGPGRAFRIGLDVSF